MPRRPHTPSRPVLATFVAIVFAAAACGGTAPSASPSASPSATVAASQAPASAVPSVSPSATASAAPSAAGETGGPIAEAVVAKLASDPFVAHVDQLAQMTGTMNGAEMEISAGMSADLSGDDVAFVIEIGVAGQESVQELRVIGDTVYLKQADDTWASAPRSAIGDTLEGLNENIRVVKDADDLRYVGVETVDGRELHHLTAAGSIPYTPSTGGTGEYQRLEVWAEADGTPVRIEGDFTATDAAGIEGTGTTTFEFSNFGGPIEIEVPPVEPSAS